MTRTICDCDQCQAGCKSMPGYLVADDLPFFNVKDLRSSEGATILTHGRVLKLPSLVPAQKENGECVFFDQGRCTVHEHSPYGCRMFSACATEDDQLQRHDGVRMLYESHRLNDEYAQLTRTLPKARKRAERKDAFERMLDAIKRQQHQIHGE